MVAQRVKRQPSCLHVCFRLDRPGNAAKIGGFRNAWQSRCVKLGLGKMEPAVDLVTEVYGETAAGPDSRQGESEDDLPRSEFSRSTEKCGSEHGSKLAPERVAMGKQRSEDACGVRSLQHRLRERPQKGGHTACSFFGERGQFGDSLHRNVAGRLASVLICFLVRGVAQWVEQRPFKPI